MVSNQHLPTSQSNRLVLPYNHDMQRQQQILLIKSHVLYQNLHVDEDYQNYTNLLGLLDLPKEFLLFHPLLMLKPFL